MFKVKKKLKKLTKKKLKENTACYHQILKMVKKNKKYHKNKELQRSKISLWKNKFKNKKIFYRKEIYRKV